MKIAAALFTLPLALAFPLTEARAQTPEDAAASAVAPAAAPAPARLVRGFAALDRATGIAEGAVGVLTLPAAEVCVERSIGCKEGDLSFALEAWQLYRANVRLAFGAGVVLGLIPTAHPPHEDPEGVQREQTRSYFTVEGIFRYYPYVVERFELWLAPTGGLVVVSDRFQVVDDTEDRALLGPRGVTIRTEGATVGLALGGAYELSQHWSFVGNARYALWFLPARPSTDPFLSEASLTGRNLVLALALGVAYRIGL